MRRRGGYSSALLCKNGIQCLVNREDFLLTLVARENILSPNLLPSAGNGYGRYRCKGCICCQ